MGIEPTLSAWEAEVLPLNYTRNQGSEHQVSFNPEPNSLLGAHPEYKSWGFFSRWAARIVVFWVTFSLVACSAPITMTRTDIETAHRKSAKSPLSGEGLSDDTHAIIKRYDLEEQFEQDPQAALHRLHVQALRDDRRDVLFALAELNYEWAKSLPDAESTQAGEFSAEDAYLQSATYAFLYLLGPGGESPPGPFDRRFREASTLYNQSVGLAFRRGGNGDDRMSFQEGLRRLPEFNLTLKLETDRLRWGFKDFSSFHSADAFDIEGFSVRNRTPGLGAPLIGVTQTSVKSPNGGALPITLFLNLKGSLGEISKGSVASIMLLSSYDEQSLNINGHVVPLEADATAPLAYRLMDKHLWLQGFERFLLGEAVDDEILLIQPYQSGRIPVVLIHGTGGSPAWWAEMVNTLRSDPAIRKHFQFWFYEYSSNLPVPTSAAELRRTLTDMVHQLDPSGKDPALQQMILIGHSQGGLLTHLMAIDSGQKLWQSISEKPFESFEADPLLKDGFRRALFFEHLPFVKRVIFMATPHRGSFLTQGWVRKMAHGLMSLPSRILGDLSPRWHQIASQLKLPPEMKDDVPTAVDGMNADNPVMNAVTERPIAHGIAAHSIIPVLPDFDIHSGNDGVVEYASAHLEGVQSESIVRSGHGVQAHPLAIEEVRRILKIHCVENPDICH